MKEIFSAGDLENAFYITPAIAVIKDEYMAAIQICWLKWFIDITLYDRS